MKFKQLKSSDIDELVLCQINLLLIQLSERAKALLKSDLVRKLREPIVWLVALDGKTIVGMGTICFRESPIDKVGTIEGVVVDIMYQGQGIGRKLNMMLIEEAKKRGIDFIELTSRPERKAANALYKELGFKKPKTNYLRLYL